MTQRSRLQIPEYSQAPNEAEIANVVETLSRLKQGRLPYELFMQMARLTTLATVELVPLRGRGKDTEVLLTQRPEGDPWENQWHVPGTVILPTDPLAHPHDYHAPLARLIGDGGELKNGVVALDEPTRIDTERRKTERGDELSVIHYVEVDGEPSEGVFYPIRDFPETVPEPGMIRHHVGFIQRAVAAYLKDKRLKSRP